MIESEHSDGHTTLHCFSIVQHNCRGSNLLFLTLFSLIRNRDISFVCLQDSDLFKVTRLGHLVFIIMIQIIVVL